MTVIREEREIPKAELARRLKITHPTLVRFEQGGNPKAVTIDRYLKAMGSSVDELLEVMRRERGLMGKS